MPKNKCCFWCGHEFKPRTAGKPQKFCSRKCKRDYEKKIHKVAKLLIELDIDIINDSINRKRGSL